MSAAPLCQLDQLGDPGSAAFVAHVDGRETAVMVIRRGNDAWVYINSCPHIGSPLDFTPGTFLNLEKTHIQCATHGALFQIDDGLCIYGPCVQARLEPVAATVRDGAVFLAP